MGRQRRPYLPGGVFHLTARTLRREHRFTPQLRHRTLGIIRLVAPNSKARILAVAVMSNHLHIVAQQGDRPLSALMKPLLHRLALRIQDAHGFDGPVFWRPYAAKACLNPSHTRNAIAYAHLNPVRAGVCDDPTSYPWTTHGIYAGVGNSNSGRDGSPLATVVDPTLALPLFATGPGRSLAQLREDYRAFMAWRQQIDRLIEDDDDPPEPPEPWRRFVWGADLSPLFHAGNPPRPDDGWPDPRFHPRRPDMATVARAVLTAEAPGVGLHQIRGRRGGARAIRLRHAVIRRLHLAGYRNVEIARFIGLSDSAISYVLCKTPA